MRLCETKNREPVWQNTVTLTVTFLWHKRKFKNREQPHASCLLPLTAFKSSPEHVNLIRNMKVASVFIIIPHILLKQYAVSKGQCNLLTDEAVEWEGQRSTTASNLEHSVSECIKNGCWSSSTWQKWKLCTKQNINCKYLHVFFCTSAKTKRHLSRFILKTLFFEWSSFAFTSTRVKF